MYISLWSEVHYAMQVEEEFIQTMLALLPHSELQYGDYLLSKSDFQRWVDLQMATNSHPIYLENEELRRIEEANPVYLLPLYHQAIETCITEKTSRDYETAVDMMKSLKKLYMKLNNKVAWDAYMDIMVKKYSRLRKLKMEMSRAKLV